MRKTYTSALCSIALMALALAGCQQERGLAPDQTPQDGSKAAQFTSGSITRVVKGTSWEGNEMIGISNVTKAEAATTNVDYKATSAGSSTNFADQGTKLLLPGDNSQVTFAAYYPYASTISEGKVSYIISKGSDQPVLFATQSGTAANPKLSFAFKHKLAQVKIILTAGEGLSLGDLTSVLYRGGVTDVKMNVLTGELTTGTTKGDITLTKETEGTYSSYIVPQAVESTFAFVMTLGDKTYTLSMDKVNKAPKMLDSGYSYTFTAKLTKEGKVVNPDGSIIGGMDDGGKGEGGNVTPDDPSTPAAAQKLPFANNFKAATSLDPFTAFSVSGEQAWRIDDSKYKNGAKMSGHVSGVRTPNEDWLISPALDFTGSEAPELIISHAINFGSDMATEQQVLISDNYTDGNPSTATWTPLTVTYPAGNNWDYVDSKTDLKAYVGKKNIHIAFKYVSTDTSAATWEIAKMEVKEATGTEPGTEGPGTEEPGTEEPGTKPEQPTTGNLLFPGANFEDWSAFTGKLFTSLQGYATQADDPDQGKVLQIKGTPKKNDYVFTVQNVEVKTANPTKITFKLKGTANGRSLSLNVHSTDTESSFFNVGDVTGDITVSASVQNGYTGSIDTGGKWVTITLDLTGVSVNTSGSGKLFALKVGKGVAWDVMVDDFKIE